MFDQTQPGTTTGALLEVLADRDGVIAYRVGTTAGPDLRTHFTGWVPPRGDAADLQDGWWSLLRPVVARAAYNRVASRVHPDAGCRSWPRRSATSTATAGTRSSSRTAARSIRRS